MWQQLPPYNPNSICWKDLPNGLFPFSLKSLFEPFFFLLGLHNLKP